MTAHLGRFPVEGDTVMVGTYDLRVKELSKRRITRIRIFEREPEDADETRTS